MALKIHRAVDYWAQHIVEQVANMQGRAASLVSAPSLKQASPHPLLSPQPRPPRKPSSPISPLPSPSTSAPTSDGGSPHGPLYAHLRNETKNTPSLYDNPHAQHGSGSAFSPPASSLYQPLQPHSGTDNDTYQVCACLTCACLPDLLTWACYPSPVDFHVLGNPMHLTKCVCVCVYMPRVSVRVCEREGESRSVCLWSGSLSLTTNLLRISRCGQSVLAHSVAYTLQCQE